MDEPRIARREHIVDMQIANPVAQEIIHPKAESSVNSVNEKFISKSMLANRADSPIEMEVYVASPDIFVGISELIALLETF